MVGSQSAELLFSHRFPNADWAHAAGKEITPNARARCRRCFAAAILRHSMALPRSGLRQAEDIVTLGNPRLKGFDPRSEPEAIPAIGAALRGVREASFKANFLRHENSDGEAGKNVSLLNKVLVSLLLVALIAWGVSFPVKDELRLGSCRRKIASSSRPSRLCAVRRINLSGCAKRQVSSAISISAAAKFYASSMNCRRRRAEQRLSIQPALSRRRFRSPGQCRKRFGVDSTARALAAFSERRV